jgi:hypothetical protein
MDAGLGWGCTLNLDANSGAPGPLDTYSRLPVSRAQSYAWEWLLISNHMAPLQTPQKKDDISPSSFNFLAGCITKLQHIHFFADVARLASATACTTQCTNPDQAPPNSPSPTSQFSSSRENTQVIVHFLEGTLASGKCLPPYQICDAMNSALCSCTDAQIRCVEYTRAGDIALTRFCLIGPRVVRQSQGVSIAWLPIP